MSDAGDAPQVSVVRYEGVEYPIQAELSKREIMEAERLIGSLDGVGVATYGLVAAYLALKREGILVGWDAFLDDADARIEQVPAPLAAQVGEAPAESSTGVTPGTGGTQTTPLSSVSSLG